MECIVLAGGLGTRLQGVIGAMPKCMALVAGQPFLFHLFQYLTTQNCQRVILSLGYQHQMVENWLVATDWEFEIEIAIEPEPLDTGGGIAFAIQKARSKNVFVLNGDTMFHVSLVSMLEFHQAHQSSVSLALKQLEHFERYGVVKMDEQDNIVSFEEKKYQQSGIINGGVYLLDKQYFESKKPAEKFSFEKDFLERFVDERKFFGFISDSYFIDIGVPEDYHQAQIDFATS